MLFSALRKSLTITCRADLLWRGSTTIKYNAEAFPYVRFPKGYVKPMLK